MKQTLTEILDKTIKCVVVKTAEAHPRRGGMALYLGFTDGTYMEIWTDESGELHPAGGVDKGGMDEIMNSNGAATILVQRIWRDEVSGRLKNEYQEPHSVRR